MAEQDTRGGRPFPISPAVLLDQARRLAGAPPPLVRSGEGLSDEEIARFLQMLPAPRAEDLRRAVSAAYYALFHAITLQAAELLAAGDLRYERTRELRHGSLDDVARRLTGAGAPPADPASPEESAAYRVRKVAYAIQRLRADREDADYNHFARFTQRWAVEAITLAMEAVELVTSRAFLTSGEGQAFLASVAEQARPRT